MVNFGELSGSKSYGIGGASVKFVELLLEDILQLKLIQ